METPAKGTKWVGKWMEGIFVCISNCYRWDLWMFTTSMFTHMYLYPYLNCKIRQLQPTQSSHWALVPMSTMGTILDQWAVFNVKPWKPWTWSFNRARAWSLYWTQRCEFTDFHYLTLSGHKRLPQVVPEIKADCVMTQDNSASLSGAITLSHFISSLLLHPFLCFLFPQQTETP